ncbi:MAG: PilT/PilU family type 4a pilus ATPase [Acidobacteria bacterium]|nr:PilT/PilU family type 4a pilus ATPase [Acidobacteriota bacterium]
MAAPGAGPISVSLDLPAGARSGTTEALLAAMLRASPALSDLIFSPGRPPQILIHGQLVAIEIPRLAMLTADHTRHIASDLIGNNKQALTTLREQGSCDVSFSLAGQARFRVNAFIQRGSCAVVMRVIPTVIPDLTSLALPPQLASVADLDSGIVLVTGPVISGKSSTLAALIDLINRRHAYHIITVEDPIEFLHTHVCSTIHQREVHSDAPSAGQALRAALRQSPNVLVLGETRERENIELLLDAAETGHLVLSSIRTVDAAKTVERIVGMFDPAEYDSVRGRLAKSFRYLISQKLIHRADGKGLVPVVEIVKANPRTRECLAHGQHVGQTLAEYARSGAEEEGMQDFDGEIEKLFRAGIIDLPAALAQARNPAYLAQVLEKL